MLQNLMVAVIQMVSAKNVESNLARAEQSVVEAVEKGASLIALPEYFPSMHSDSSYKLKIAEQYGKGVIQDKMAELAQKHNVWIVAGSIPVKGRQADKVTNTSLVFAPDGHCVARYDKVHLFDFQRGEEIYKESDSHEAGLQPVCFDTPWGRIGLAVCYDLRFPELFRKLDNPDIIIVPSAFTVPTGQAHWELLLKARAVENQCYVLAPAQGGVHENGRSTWGHSMIIDPWGEVLSEVTEAGDAVICAELSRDRFNEIRQQLPAWLHRRL
ncbi:carbon-nitrogen hydrolase family protein [Oceanospirillum sediminis]|uniref:Carbon-nitrogen hydrolase family protein n=1 Tax=Oceanospirillum sediminis TaxID=2760088 RepID=A0A839IXG0_9GAMM|nr:carbon-nitrogen hydrolase family protein [Oceanospirillum sediminis]MBB1489294.1 carbon-nitrogen hydrolase family protein [Oceanospirillum sediminis]